LPHCLINLKYTHCVRARWGGRLAAIVVAGAGLIASGGAEPQRRGGLGRGVPFGQSWVYDGAFAFCRLAFSQSPWGDGGGWSVDYPRADLNFPFRLGELTTTSISHDSRGEPNHNVVTLMDPHLFECPFVMMTEPGGAYFSPEEAANLRLYLEKGGFLWADDFWGEYAWQVWENELRKALPANQYPIVDVPMDHPIMHARYWVQKVPQIPSINHWFATSDTSERADSREVHVRAALNERGRIIVLMTHNTDFGDAFEREGENREYFDQFAAVGYAFGVNVYVYALSH